MRKRLVGIFACLLALCVALVGCGGSGSDANYGEAFVGVWQLKSVSTDGTTSVSADDLADFEASGLMSGMELQEGGSGTMVLFGEESGISWGAEQEGSGTITFGDSQGTMTLSGSTLVISDGTTELEFVSNPSYDLSGTSSAPAPAPSAPSANASGVAGVWRLEEIVSDDEDSATSAEDLATINELGLRCGVELYDDGTGRFVLFGEEMDVAWELDGGSTGTFTLGGSVAQMTVEGDQLTLTNDGGDTMRLVRDDAYDLDSSADVSEVTGTGTDIDFGDEDEVFIEIGQTIVDDDLVTIEVLGKGTDWAGDPYYRLRVTNNSDRTIYVTDSWDSFSLNGMMADPVLGITVKPGAYAEDDMWWSSSDVGEGGVELLVNVDGSLEVWDDETYDTLATYDFQME